MPSSIPQSVTTRYASNLLRDGRNSDFTVAGIEREPSIVEGHLVGYYYRARVSHLEKVERGVGASPLAAVTKALELLGVTFR